MKTKIADQSQNREAFGRLQFYAKGSSTHAYNACILKNNDTFINRLSHVPIKLRGKLKLKVGLFVRFSPGESRCDGMRYKCAKKHGLHS